MILNVTFPVRGVLNSFNPDINDQQGAVLKALDVALEAMGKATPRIQDYRTDCDDGEFHKALREHRERMEMVRAVRDATYQIAFSVCG